MSTTPRQRQFSLPSLVFAFFSLLKLASAGCYWANGTDRNAAYNASVGGAMTSDDYNPCPVAAEASASMCCAAWNLCTPDGLCLDTNEVYWRESCSDPTWVSPACIKLFINGTGAGNDINVTQCYDGSFCYDGGNTGCCDADRGVYIVDGDQKPHNFNATSTSSSSTSTTSHTAAATSHAVATSASSASSVPTSSGGLSIGAKVGIGIGTSLGGLLVLGLLLWFLMRRRTSKAQAYNSARNNSRTAEKGTENVMLPGAVKQPFTMHEADSDHHVPRAEMPATRPARYRDGLAELGDTER